MAVSPLGNHASRVETLRLASLAGRVVRHYEYYPRYFGVLDRVQIDTAWQILRCPPQLDHILDSILVGFGNGLGYHRLAAILVRRDRKQHDAMDTGDSYGRVVFYQQRVDYPGRDGYVFLSDDLSPHCSMDGVWYPFRPIDSKGKKEFF